MSVKRASQFLALFLIVVTTNVHAADLVGFKAYPEFGLTASALKAAVKTSTTKHNNLNEIARDLTLFYRDNGLSFHQVIVRQGKLVLIEGMLTNVVVPNEAWSKLINSAISNLKGKVVYEPRIRNTLLKLNHWPGIELFSFYSVADSNGGVNLNVIVKASKKVDLYTSMDNFGSTTLGKNRLMFNANAYNVLLKPSQAGITGQISSAPNNYSISMNLMQYLNLDQLWRVSLSAQRMSLETNIPSLNVNDNQGVFNLDGTNLSAKATAQWNLQPTALKSNSRKMWVKYSLSELISDPDVSLLNKSSSYLQSGASYSMSVLSPNNKSQINADTQWVVGFTLKQETITPNAQWSGKVKMSSTWRRTLSKGLYRNQDMVLGFKGQLGSPNMHSSERFALTGQGGLTQFAPSKASTEQAILLDAKVFLLQGALGPVTYDLQTKAQAGLGYSKPNDDSELIIQLAGASVHSNIKYSDFSAQASFEQPLVAPDGWDTSSHVLFKVAYEKQF